LSNITLSVPNEIHKEMKQYSEVRWSEVARKAITEKLDALRLADRLAKKSKLSQEDVEEFSRKIKALATKRLRE